MGLPFEAGLFLIVFFIMSVMILVSVILWEKYEIEKYRAQFFGKQQDDLEHQIELEDDTKEQEASAELSEEDVQDVLKAECDESKIDE